MSSTALHPPAQDNKDRKDDKDFMDRSQVAVIIPTYRAAGHWKNLTAALAQQDLPSNQVLIVDSGSDDGTDTLAEAAGFRLLRIPQSEFNHGGTRQLAALQVPWAKIVIYLTQDALPKPGALNTLLRAFDDPTIGAAFGRQLPRHGAGIIEAHARAFNYPAQSSVRTLDSRREFGFRTTFFSNSFGAYRREALDQAGGFPSDTILSEDSVVAGRLLILGWKTAYVADAEVNHSHGFTIAQEFRRYFDIGVCHARERWLREWFGNPGGAGVKFVLSQMRTLVPRHMHLMPSALVRTAAKLAGYKLGLAEAKLGKTWCRRLSYHTGYWDSPANSPRIDSGR